MPKITLPILALALGAALAVGLVSCGGDSEGLLPGDNAEQIVDNLNEVERLTANGDCEAAAAAAEEVQAQIDALGNDVNAQLRQRLSDGAAELAEVIPSDCEEATATTQPPTEETTEETTPEETTDTTTTTTTTDETTTTTEPTTTTETTDGGGTPAPPPPPAEETP